MTAARPRYADPTRCPDCRTELRVAPFRCPTCALPLRSHLATELLRTLGEADDLLDRLRASAIAPAAPTVTAAAASGAPAVDPDPSPRTPPRPSARRGVRATSVPTILLGLGATCLLVAALIFLAVAWTWLGIGGRTAVLVGLTVTAGATGHLLGRRGLTIAAEALTTVAFGLLVLDAVGADHAGWLGALSLEGLVRLVGAALLVPGLALSARPDRLVVSQLAAPAGLALVLVSINWTPYHLGAVDAAGFGCVAAFAALAALARRLGARVLAGTAVVLAAVVWAGSGLAALAMTIAHPTGRELWVAGHGWELVLMSLVSLLAWTLGWTNAFLRQGPAALIATTLTFAVVLPGLDGTANGIALIAVVTTLAWTAVAAVTPPAWYTVPRVPLLAGAVGLLGVAALMISFAVGTIWFVGDPFSQPVAVRLRSLDQPLHPLLLLAAVAALALAALLALPRSSWTVPVAATAVGIGGLATLGLYPVPLWVVVAAFALLAVALLTRGLDDESSAAQAAGGGALGLLVVVTALPSAVLATVALALVVVALVVTLVVGRFPSAPEMSGLALPIAVGALIWSAADVAGVELAFRAAPVLLAVGALALVRPRVEVETAAAGTGLLTAFWAVPYAADPSVSLALHLTLAGALVTGSSIVHPSRRPLAWPGGVLLASATWVRLADVGVVAPEPYTLPTAVALLLVGLHRLGASEDASTTLALGPGLVLGTVPSLLWVLNDPVTPRATVLGVSCLALVLGGAALRWHAPVVVGSVVGATVVLRELAPYALQTPQWIVIGTAGAVLIACGITWESRMRDLQHASAYLGRLR